jgi:dCMP deaminase
MGNWDARFLGMAQFVSTWSKDPRKQVGAVVVSPDRRRFSAGFNGLPRDWEALSARMGVGIMDKATKNRYSLHAEANAIAQAGAELNGWTIYVTEAPCLDCALAIHRAGIAKVVTVPIDEGSSWAADQIDAQRLLAAAGIPVLTVEVSDA